MSNYSFVVDNTFSPFTMQEMLVPFTAYKDSFEKTEEAYNDLSDKSDAFKYLSDTLPEGSKARSIYEGYANNLRAQAEDLAHNGLTIGNRRALTSLKRRYQGEIGRLMKADTAMAEEKKLRQAMGAQDSSRLYATDNLNIDDFLDGKNPNLYSISGNELYTRGAAAGKAASSRVFSAGDAGSTLNGYYRDYVQKLGYSRETIQKFYQDMAAIPELQMAADAILEERGANQNLTGDNLRRARQSVINGMIDGAIYTEQHSPQRDLGVLTKAEQVADTRAKQQQAITMWQAGAKFDSKGNVVSDTDNINYQTKQAANEAAQAQLDIMYPIGEDGKRHLNPDYKMGTGGKPVVDKGTKKSLESRMAKLKTDDLANPNGFTDTDGTNVTHYKYKAAAIRKGNDYKVGNIGADIPDTWGDWGIGDSKLATSMSLGLFGGGNYQVPKKSKSLNMRVLTEGEIAQLPQTIKGSFEHYLSEENTPYQIIEVLREDGTADYLFASAE